jgi:hypothetical protein
MVLLDGALLRIDRLIDNGSDDPMNLDEYQYTLANIKSSRGKAIRRLVYDTFRRFFNGTTSRLEWADTYRSLTLYLYLFRGAASFRDRPDASLNDFSINNLLPTTRIVPREIRLHCGPALVTDLGSTGDCCPASSGFNPLPRYRQKFRLSSSRRGIAAFR